MGLCVVQHEEVPETTEPTPAEQSRFTVNRHWIAFNTDTFQIYHEFASAAVIVDMAQALDVNMSKWIFMSHNSGRYRLMNKDMIRSVLRNKDVYYIQVQPEYDLYDIKNALVQFCEDNPGQLTE